MEDAPRSSPPPPPPPTARWRLLASNPRRVLTTPSFTVIATFLALLLLSCLSLRPFSSGALPGRAAAAVTAPSPPSCAAFYTPGERASAASIVEFGGVGDGATSNTLAFRRAIAALAGAAASGGATLTVPSGRWVTGSFNLTSQLTLFLESGAEILGSEDPEEWPLIAPLPSYGRGRERPGPRRISLIHGDGLHDVVIAGEKGSVVDGRGRMWWEMWWNRSLQHTRGHLVELVNVTGVAVSGVTFKNSPFWTIHPVYCSGVVIRNLTILADLHSPNTDGIDPDSCTNVCIEDCYIESGDDLVAVKSGWDRYGVEVARPSANIVIQRVSGTTPTCSGVGIGSEMSGGVANVTIRDIRVWNSSSAVRIKTDVGRGGYIVNVTVAGVEMTNVKVPIRFSRGANDHPAEEYDAAALPRVSGISVINVTGVGVERAPVLEAVDGAVYDKICFLNVSLSGIRRQEEWQCGGAIVGEAHGVSPPACEQLRSANSSSSWCSQP